MSDQLYPDLRIINYYGDFIFYTNFEINLIIKKTHSIME
jgi:hypothetical protein